MQIKFSQFRHIFFLDDFKVLIEELTAELDAVAAEKIRLRAAGAGPGVGFARIHPRVGPVIR